MTARLLKAERLKVRVCNHARDKVDDARTSIITGTVVFRWIGSCKGPQSSSKSLRTAESHWFKRFVYSCTQPHLHVGVNPRGGGKKEPLHPPTALSLCIYLPIDPQVEDLHTELMKMRKEKTELQSVQLEAPQHVAQSRANDIHREMGRSRRHWSGNEYIIEWTKRGRRCFTPSI